MNRKNGKTRSMRVRILTALTIFVMVIVGMTWTGFAEDTLADVFDKGFKVTVNAPEGTQYQSLNEADVTLDFYRIATATPRGDSDVLDVTWKEGFKTIGDAWEKAEEKAVSGETPIKAADILALAQGAAKIVLADVPEYKSSQQAAETNPDKTGELGKAVDLGNKGGIYLVIAHGDLPDYKITEDTEAKDLSTAVEGDSQLYQFAPMLVTVPNKGSTDLDDKGEIKGKVSGDVLAKYSIGYGNELSEEPWTGEVEINAKVGVEEMGGVLKITKTQFVKKTLSGEMNEKVTVIFEVKVTTGTGDSAETVYDDIVTMVFTETDTKTVTIKGLPIGAHAVVTETYVNLGYSLVTEKTVEKDIVADDPDTEEVEVAEAEFTNMYNDGVDGGIDGGSVINHFEADADGEWDAEKSTKTYSGGKTENLFE